MGMGALIGPTNSSRAFALQIKAIKLKYGLPSHFEIKWTKVSKGRLDFYLELIDQFFLMPEWNFRVLIIQDKKRLDHHAYDQTHDDFYYKIYYTLLHPVISSEANYNITLDIKDTHGGEKTRKLTKILRVKSPERQTVNPINLARSDEVAQLQIVDLLLGAIVYHHRGIKTNQAKMAIVERIKEKTGLKLIASTSPCRPKFDHFIWEPDYKNEC
jgi:hypothetical protein